MSSAVLTAVREKFPVYADVPDSELALAIGQQYPAYLEDPEFKAEHDGFLQPDEAFVGQEIRGVGRALKRGALAADQAAAAIGVEFNAMGSRADLAQLNQLQDELDQWDREAAANPQAGATPQAQQWRQNQLGKIGVLQAELDRRLPMIPKSLEQIARREEQIKSLPPSPDMANLQSDFWKTLATNPVETVATVVAESVPQMIPGMVIGAATGNPVGVAAGAGLNSFAVEYANSLLESARADGVDIADPQAAAAWFSNPDRLGAARVKAVERGIPVGAFDAATAGLAGRFLKPALGQGTKQVLTASAQELALQAGGGMAGEAAGQLASEGKITSVPDIVLEGVAELGSAPAEVYGNLRKRPVAEAAPTQSLPTGVWADDPRARQMVAAESAAAQSPEVGDIENELPAADPVPVAPPPAANSVPSLEGIPGDTQGQVEPAGATAESGASETQGASADQSAGETLPPATAESAASGEVPAEATATFATPEPEPPSIPARFLGSAATALRWALDNLRGKSVVNEETGYDIGIGRAGLEKAASSSAWRKSASIAAHLDTFQVLPELLRTAKLVAAYEDRRSDPNLRRVLRFQTPATWSGRQFQALLTVKEYAHESQGRKYYTHELSEIELPARSLGDAHPAGPTSPTQAGNPVQNEPQAGSVNAPAPTEDPVLSALDRAKINTEGKVFDATAGVPIAIWNSLIEVVKLAYRGGKSLAEAAQAGIAWLREQGHSFDEAQVLAAIESSLGERQYADQLDASPDVSSEVQGGLENRLYVKRPNETSAGAAERILRAMGGPRQAIAVYTDQTNGLDGATRMMLGQMIIKRFAEQERTARGQGDTARADELAQLQIRFIDDTFLPATTDIAQALQALAAFQFMTPQGIVSYARRQIERARDNIGGRMRPGTDAVVDALGKVNAEGIDGVLNQKASQEGARKVIDDAVAANAEREGSDLRNALALEVTNSLDQMAPARDARKAAALAALQNLGRDTYWGGIVKSSAKALENRIAKLLGTAGSKAYTVSSIAADVTAALQEQIRKTLNLQPGAAAPAPATYFQRLKTILSNREQAAQIWAAARESLLAKYDGDVALSTAFAQDFSEWAPSLLRSVVDEHLQGLDVRLRELVSEHYRLKDGALRDKLVQMLGVDDPTATRLAREFDGLFAVEFAKAKVGLKGRMAAVRKDPLLMRAARSGVVDLQALPNSEVDKLLAREITKTRLKLGTLVREHFTKVQAAGTKLVESLTAQAGLPEASAREFADALQKRFAAAVAERKRREIKRIEDATPSTPAKVKQAWQRLVEMSNLGALDSQLAWDVVRERLDLPAWTPELATEINRRADEIQRAPEGTPRERKIAEMLNHLAAAKGISTADKAMAFWYANTLSGPLTHVANLVGNVANLATNLAIAARRPTLWADQFVALARGLKTGAEAAGEIMQSGFVVGRSDKFRAGGTLEVWRPEGRADYLLTPWRLVGRALSALDALFFQGAKTMRASMLANLVAKSEGLEGKSARIRALEILGQVPKARAAAEAQAAKEGLSGRQARLRVEELLERGQPESLRENARQYGLRVTYNQKPYGVLGDLASAINSFGSDHWWARLFVPFTNIIANIANESLHYTPIGAVRAIQAQRSGILDGRPIGTREDLYDQWAKAALGTVLLGTVGAAAMKELDDPEAFFGLNGAGPRSKSKREQLKAQGWRPNTFRFGDRYVSYVNTPMAIPLAILGNWIDGIKYQHLDERDGMNRLAFLLATSGDVITQQSFLSGLAGLTRFLESDNSKRGTDFVRAVGGTAANFVVPNAIRFVDRVFDPTVYDAKTVETALAQSIPFVRAAGKPALNVWGEPVRVPVTDRFTTIRQLDPALEVLARRGLWISAPNQESTLLNGKPMADDEWYDFIQARGQALKKTLSIPSLQSALAKVPDKVAGNIMDRINRNASIAGRVAVLRKRNSGRNTASEAVLAE